MMPEARDPGKAKAPTVAGGALVWIAEPNRQRARTEDTPPEGVFFMVVRFCMLFGMAAVIAGRGGVVNGG
jgi:hypothetical protein